MPCCSAFAAHAAEPKQFIFAWPLDETALKPRGATTRGAPVTLDPVPGEAWKRLTEPGLTAQERDRRAILAMAGPYRVSFDFLEVVRYDPALKPDAPYQSWGTEYVFVAEDRPDFIALQHILVMRLLEKDQPSEPMVVRHWRQEWRYQADALLAYEGANTWARRAVASETSGVWTQSVLQVDDSPRYAARGRWQHAGGVSTWISRRDLAAAAAARVQRAQGLRRAGRHQPPHHHAAGLGAGREQPQARGRESGKHACPGIRRGALRAHPRLRLRPGETYYERTEPFWAEVRAAWRELEQGRGRFSVRAPVDQGQLFMPFFDYAQRLADGAAFDRDEARTFVRRTLQNDYLK